MEDFFEKYITGFPAASEAPVHPVRASDSKKQLTASTAKSEDEIARFKEFTEALSVFENAKTDALHNHNDRIATGSASGEGELEVRAGACQWDALYYC